MLKLLRALIRRLKKAPKKAKPKIKNQIAAEKKKLQDYIKQIEENLENAGDPVERAKWEKALRDLKEQLKNLE